MKLKSLWIAGLLLAATGGQVQAGFINGSFESPSVANGAYINYLGTTNIGGWTIVGVDSSVVHSFVQNGITFQAQHGDNWIDLAGVNSNSPTSGVSQSVSTTSGGAYELSFYVGSATDTGYSPHYFFASTVDLSIDGGDRMHFTNLTTPTNMLDWKKFTVAFSAQSSNTSFIFYNGSSAANFLSGLDNVSLAPTAATPEPASLLLLGTGLGGIALATWRRKKV